MSSMMTALELAKKSIDRAKDELIDARETIGFLAKQLDSVAEIIANQATIDPLPYNAPERAILEGKLAKIAIRENIIHALTGFSFTDGQYHVFEVVSGEDAEVDSVLDALNEARLFQARGEAYRSVVDPDNEDGVHDPQVYIGFRDTIYVPLSEVLEID